MSGPGSISVITVVRNDAHHLEETILSVIEQKRYAEIDIIIIDGASTDGTAEVIKKYVEFISYWVSEPDKGIYDAMNKGWAAADDNSYILFLGAGDRIVSLPQALSGINREEVLYGFVRMGDKALFRSRADFHLKLYNSLHHQALLVKKALHPSPPFNCDYPVYADFDFNQRLKKSGVNFVYSPDFIGYARPDGVSDNPCFFESVRIISVNFGLLWAVTALFSYFIMKTIPFLNWVRPIKKYNSTEI